MSNRVIYPKKSAGGVVHLNGKFLAIHLTNLNEIAFPKGTMEANETPEQTAIREVLEETGYQVLTKVALGEVSYEFDDDDGNRYRKTVYHFLFELADESQEPTPSLEAYEAAAGMVNLWLTAEEALNRLTHDDSKEVLRRALIILEP